MKRYCSLKSLVLIFALLTSQIGSAFAFSTQMQDCGMDMAANEEHVTSAMISDMAQTMSNAHSTSDSSGSPDLEIATGKMDCCDHEAINACCDSDDCQCSSVVSANLFVSETELNKTQKNNVTPVTLNITNPLSPFLHQPKRPPIKTFS